MIHNAARGAYHHLHAAFKSAELAFNGLTAVYGQNSNAAHAGGQFAEFFGNLDGKLARGAKHQRLHRPCGGELFQNGHAKGGCFAGAGLGLTYRIAASQQKGDGKHLNGRGFFKTHILDGLQ